MGQRASTQAAASTHLEKEQQDAYDDVERINRELDGIPMGAGETMLTRRSLAYACDGCRASFRPDQVRNCCVADECLRTRQTLDLCERCSVGHPHPMHAANPSGPRILRGHRTVAEVLDDRLRGYEERAAIGVFGSGDNDALTLTWITYGQLHRRALALLVWLRDAHGVEAGARVVLWGRNSLAWIVADVALQLGGVVAVVIESGSAVAHTLIAGSGARVALCDADLLASLLAAPPPPDVVLVALDAAATHSAPVADVACVPVCRTRDPRDDATIIYTSGSTGVPKGVRVPNAQLRSHVGRSFAAVGATLLVTAVYEPLALATQRMSLYNVLGNGGRAALVAAGRIDAAFWRRVAAVAPTVFSGPPALFTSLWKDYVRDRAAAEARGHDDEAATIAQYRALLGGRVASLGTGGAPIAAAALAWMRALWPGAYSSYGTTECGHIALNGELAANVRVKLVALPADHPYGGDAVVGELWVHTGVATRGYIGADAAPICDAEGYLSTGDVVRLTGRHIDVLDRVTAWLKLGNAKWVSPAAVEAAVLETLPAVRKCFVWAPPGGTLAAVVALDAEGAATGTPDDDDDAVAHAVRDAVAACGQALPGAVLVERWPQGCREWDERFATPSGKQSRPKLIAHYSARLSAMLQHNEHLERVRAAVAVGDAPAGLTLAQLGMRSIESVRVGAALGLPAGVAVPHATVAQLATALAQRLPWPALRSDARVLLTGATGYLGVHVLAHLLAASACTIVCPVRGPQPLQRLVATLRFYGLLSAGVDDGGNDDDAVAVLGARVRAVSCNLAGDNMEQLFCDGGDNAVDVVVHAAATVSAVASFDTLYADNVGATLKLLALRKPFVYVSTLSVLAPAHTGEDAPPHVDATVMGGYAASKAAAEAAVRCARVPWAVVRPGLVVGRHTVNPTDWIGRYLLSVQQCGVGLGAQPLALPLVSPMWIARVVHNILFGGGASVPPCLHCVETARVDHAQLHRAVPHARMAGGAEWLGVVRAHQPPLPVHALLGMFAGGAFPSYDRRGFSQTLCEAFVAPGDGQDAPDFGAIGEWLRTCK